MSISAIDLHVVTWVNQHRSDLSDGFFIVVTWAGSLFMLLPLTALMIGYLLYYKKNADISFLGLGFGGAVLLTYLLKVLIKRPRPEMFEPLVAMPADFSFPSAHTAQITAFCLCLLLIVGKDRPLFYGLLCAVSITLIGCVAYSRLYLQVHFASDVMAGLLLSSLWVLAVTLMLHRF